MYQPDRVFVQDLKRLDPKLGCYYERNHNHFVVTYERAIGGSVPVMMVKDDAGGFRQPDRRDIDRLKEGDNQRVDPATRVKIAAAYMEKERELQRKKRRDEIRNMTKDNKLQLAPRMAKLAGGKHNSVFRRVEPKPKGKTVDQL
jgi:hypothetical protein